MIIPNENYKSEPIWIFKYRGLIMALVTLAVLICASPSRLSFIAGFSLSLIGEAVRLWALGWTGEHTRRQTLEAPVLIVNGPYRFIRNPLYLGNILTALGVLTASCGSMTFLKAAFLMLFGSAAVYLVYASCIISEEAFLAVRFGNIFFDYRACTPTILPRISDVVKAVLGKDSCQRRVVPGRGFTEETISEKKEGRSTDPCFCLDSLKFEVSSLIWLSLVWVYLAYLLI